MSVTDVPDGLGELGEHEPVLGADLLAGRPGVLGVAQPHERDRRVPPAEPLPDLARDRPVGEHQPGPGGLAGVGEPVEHVAAELVRAEPGTACAATAGPAAGLAQQVGERGDHVGCRAPGCRQRPGPPVQRRPPAACCGGSATGSAPSRVQLAQLRLHRPGPLDHHPVGRAPAEQRAELRSSWSRGEQPGREVLARVADLGQRPQRGGDLARSSPSRPSTSMTRSRIALSIASVAGRPPSSLDARPTGRARRRGPRAGEVARPGRAGAGHAGSTQTSGLDPDRPATASRSLATAPSDRSSTVTLAARGEPGRRDHGEQRGPAGQRAAGHVDPVDRRRQRDRVPLRCRSKASRRSLPVPEPAGRAPPAGEQPAFLLGPDLSTRCRSPRRMAAGPARPARCAARARPAPTRQAIAPARRSPQFSQPAAQTAISRPASTTAAPPASFSGRSSRFSSRRCAASQSGLSCSGSGGVGRLGGGPGSGCSNACCQPR